MAEDESNRVAADSHEELSHRLTIEFHSDEESESSTESREDLSFSSETELASTDIPNALASSQAVNIVGDKNKVYNKWKFIIKKASFKERRKPFQKSQEAKKSVRKRNLSSQAPVIPNRSSDVPYSQLPSRDPPFNSLSQTENLSNLQQRMEQLSQQIDEVSVKIESIEPVLHKVEKESKGSQKHQNSTNDTFENPDKLKKLLSHSLTTDSHEELSYRQKIELHSYEESESSTESKEDLSSSSETELASTDIQNELVSCQAVNIVDDKNKVCNKWKLIKNVFKESRSSTQKSKEAKASVTKGNQSNRSAVIPNRSSDVPCSQLPNRHPPLNSFSETETLINLQHRVEQLGKQIDEVSTKVKSIEPLFNEIYKERKGSQEHQNIASSNTFEESGKQEKMLSHSCKEPLAQLFVPEKGFKMDENLRLSICTAWANRLFFTSVEILLLVYFLVLLLFFLPLLCWTYGMPNQLFYSIVGVLTFTASCFCAISPSSLRLSAGVHTANVSIKVNYTTGMSANALQNDTIVTTFSVYVDRLYLSDDLGCSPPPVSSYSVNLTSLL